MRYSLFVLFLTLSLQVFGQSSFVPLNEDYYHMVDRYEIKAGRVMPQFFSSVKGYKRSDVMDFADSIEGLGGFQSKADRFNYEYLQNDNWEWSKAETSNSKKPFLKHLYRKKSDLFHVDVPDFDLHINPVLYLGAGKDSQRDDMLFINTRGVEVRGMIDGKVGFYTYLADNQMVLPSYVWDQMSLNPVIPHEGFWKEFKDGKGVDFLHGRGYITVDATKHINLQLGYDRFFIGNGMRSLIFSDYAPSASFFRADIKVWKLNYVYMISEMTADVNGSLGGNTSGNYPDKFVTFHHLSINIGKKFNLGLFESVIFSPDDTLSGGKFEWAYLNPIIFFRAIEQQSGSTDNVLLGLDFKWNAVKKLSFYGQFVLDEFVLDNIKEGNGWWANKFAVQIGGKYVDAFGVPNLDFQGEVNLARPFTYSHHTQYANYTHYQQPIGHPLGANFTELVGVARYQPLPRLNITGKLMFMNVGRDSTDYNWGSNDLAANDYKYNWGGDLLKNNSTRELEYGNEIGQGFKNDIVYGSFTASWQLKHNLFIDGTLVIRKSSSVLELYNKNASITSLALRWNIARRLYEF